MGHRDSPAPLRRSVLQALLEEGDEVKRHRWENGNTCKDCGLHREGAGYGPYGAMRYYRDYSTFYDYKPGACAADSAAKVCEEKSPQ